MERKHATMLQNIRSDNNMNESCVKIYSTEGRERAVISFILVIFCFTHYHEHFEICGVLNANYGL